MSNGWGPLFFLVGVGGVAIAAWEIYRVVQANAAGAAPGGGTVDPPQDPSQIPYTPPAAQIPQQPAPYYQAPAYYPATPIYPPAPAAPVGAGARSVSVAGKQRIKAAEGLRLARYKDGPGYSIGYGHFIKPGENYTTITSLKALQLFNADIANVQQIINAHVRVALTQNEYDVLADVVYNKGSIPSALLSRVNAGDVAGARALLGVYSSTATLPGLQTRWFNDEGLYA